MQLNIAIQSGSGRSKSLTAERLVNLYAEKSPTNAKNKVNLVGAPGLTLFASCGLGPIRGMAVMAGDLYVVSGSFLYLVNRVGVETSLGHIDGVGLVSMATNGDQLCIVTSTTHGYIYDQVTLEQITDADFPGATSVDYLDGYFIFSTPDSGQFFISALQDGTTYDALDFATAESAPDNLVRVFVDHRELLLFGETTIEPWFNAGGADFPFSRIPQAIAEKGLASRDSVARSDNSTFWLDHEGVVRRLGSGYVPTRISTHAIESSLGDTTTSSAFGYTLEGHETYVLTTTSGTFLYDSATQLWHERKSHGQDTWNANTHVSAYGFHLVGSRHNGDVYRLSLDVNDENNEPLVAEIIFPPISNEGKRFTVAEVYLDCEMGVGLSSQDDPLVTLQTSKNGKEWSLQHPVSLGKQGEYDAQARWRRLGQYTNLHLKFTISAPVKRALYTAYAMIRGDD